MQFPAVELILFINSLDSSDSLLIREMLSSRALNGATFGLHSTRWLLVDAF